MSDSTPAGNATGDGHNEAARRPWESLRLTYLGNAAEFLQTSQGKLSLPSFDTGDRQTKQRGQG